MEQDKYSEALERAKAWAEGTLSPETTSPKEVIELIFPELAESEDERIRKELVQYLKDYPNIPTGQYSKSDFFAYLEKLKEIPMPSSTELIEKWDKEKTMLEEKDFRGDEWRLAYTAYMDGFADGACVKLGKQKEQKPILFKNENLSELIKAEFEGFRNLLKKNGLDYEPQQIYWDDFARLFDSSAREYLKEQKPAEWTKEDKLMLDAVISIVEDWENGQSEEDKEYCGATAKSDWLKSLRPQPKQEWSEEDKKLFDLTIINLTELKDRFGENYGKVGNCINWLKSLRPQLRQEWSEEDTLYLNVCKNALLLYDKTHHWDAYTIYSWLEKRLKSLCPQPRWKPTEEQMEALKNVVEDRKVRYMTSVSGDNTYLGLNSLYNDLQKLMQ